MDFLYLNTIAFPVRRASFSRNVVEWGMHSWSIEIHCGESPQLEWRSWRDDRAETDLDWLASTEPSLYAQMLPLPADAPDELIGGTYAFPQSPYDDPADWDRGVGWLFFCLYLHEHDLVYPTTIAFMEKQGPKYRVKISGSYPANRVCYDLRVETSLDWEET